MSGDGFGSNDKPYVEFPFDNVKEVHWPPKGAIVLAEIGFPLFMRADNGLFFFASGSFGKYPAGGEIPKSNYPAPGSNANLGYTNVPFLSPALDDGNPTGLFSQGLAVQHDRYTTVLPLKRGDVYWGHNGRLSQGNIAAGRTWDSVGSFGDPGSWNATWAFTADNWPADPHLINTDEFEYAFWNSTVAGDTEMRVAQAPFGVHFPDKVQNWVAVFQSHQFGIRETFAIAPVLCNLLENPKDVPDGWLTETKMKTITITAPAVGPIDNTSSGFDDYLPNPDASFNLPSRFRCYKGGKFFLNATATDSSTLHDVGLVNGFNDIGIGDIVNVGGTLVWDSGPIAPAPYDGAEHQLGSFTASKFTPPTP